MAIPIGIVLKLGPYLKKYWKIIVIVIALIAFGVHYNGLHSTITDQNKRHTKLVASTAAAAQLCKDNRITLETAIDEQNGAITSLNKLLQDKGVIIDQFQLDAFDAAVKHKKELDDIKNEERPKTCEESINYLLDGVGELQWSE